MHPLFRRIGAINRLFLLVFGLLLAYNLKLAAANEYLGYQVFVFDLSYVLVVFVAVILLGVFMPVGIRVPSDFFTFLYGLFVIFPYTILHLIRGPVTPLEFIRCFLILAVPFFVVRVSASILPKVRFPGFFSYNFVLLLLIPLSITGVFLALANPPGSAGFDLGTSYVRRLEGREIFSVGTPLAYLNSAIVNGFAPFFAFVAGWQRRYGLLFFALLCWLSFFYLLGVKAPLLFIGVAFIIGTRASVGRLYSLVNIIYICIFLAFFVFLVEYLFFDYSYVADYFIRRAMSVPAWLISAYFEFMSSTDSTLWSPLTGIASNEPVTMVVGQEFLGLPGLNANTNAFVYQLASGGFLMYVLTVALVAFVFAMLDSVYSSNRNPALIYIGFSYAILLTEQAATTALVSSGLGVLIMLLIFSRNSGSPNDDLRLNKV
ncbi:hypothetical protein [Pseudomonas auratipiscis]|uniref:Uncharacterized protein n=1 Tax=Pseudomonas auratipiscis TaxID=3115853 RepID=A0AB35WYL7_9PSED|nr:MULTISPECIES: hypothetical protein [unclassified Pseudomonas]MEE1867169.1 hypothetical protein [Pseudomonas sp. 120P]MEE1957996.1 hypothetical protein [Pseudomonas sp. 119P]